MFGSRLVQMITGRWDHIGYMSTSGLVLPDPNFVIPDPNIVAGTLTKGTWLQSAPGVLDNVGQLASGLAYGFMTQDITLLGQTSLDSFKNRVIGKFDLPIAIGQAVSVRLPSAGAIIEFEGHGAAVPGNLVCDTTTTGLLSTSTARGSRLSFLNGCIRVAQSGDVSQLFMIDANVTPLIAGNLRIRVKMSAGDIV